MLRHSLSKKKTPIFMGVFTILQRSESESVTRNRKFAGFSLFTTKIYMFGHSTDSVPWNTSFSIKTCAKFVQKKAQEAFYGTPNLWHGSIRVFAHLFRSSRFQYRGYQLLRFVLYNLCMCYFQVETWNNRSEVQINAQFDFFCNSVSQFLFFGSHFRSFSAENISLYIC